MCIWEWEQCECGCDRSSCSSEEEIGSGKTAYDERRTHLFLAGDHNHPQTDEIFAMLSRLNDLINVTSGDMVHGERLAIAFALLITEVEQDILVIKNLRVCGDRQVFIKLVSKVVSWVKQSNFGSPTQLGNCVPM
uniref:Putative DYW domain-containing protein n=1 Tax=Helianthus annuus TaxID=4232 RepID=A0A251SRT3_HELAN